MPEQEVMDMLYSWGGLTIVLAIPLLMLFFWDPKESRRKDV